jgi:hypothetical protein
MSTNFKEATVYSDPELDRTLRIGAAETGQSMPELVNEAVSSALQGMQKIWSRLQKGRTSLVFLLKASYKISNGVEEYRVSIRRSVVVEIQGMSQR